MIYPKPQVFALSGEPILTGIPAFTVCGELSEYSDKLLSNAFSGKVQSGSLSVNITVSDNEKTSYIPKTHRVSDEKYRLDISADCGVEILVSCKRALFRALNTLIKLIEAGQLCAGYIEDYPLFEKRGYIEGFYGNVWEDSKRKSVLTLMAKHGMNTFYYAPKDDPYHRAKWRELYPQKELSALLELFELATENEVDFYYCIAPGLSMRYTSEDDYSTLLNKLKSLYAIGIKRFGLLLDDIPAELQYPEDKEKYGETVHAHIDLVNRAYSDLAAIDRSIELTMCPLQYHGKGNEYFISKLGQGLESDINIFWTGAEICSRELTSLEAIRFSESTRHKPLYWDNYPVNDAEMFNEMHLGPIMGRDADLYRYSRGLISNVMEYAECSKIPLLTIADYLWNPEEYDSEESYTYALKTVLGDKAELFGYFSDHLQVSCLTKHSSAFLSETLEKASFEMGNGEPLKAFSILTDYLERAKECSEMLKDTSVPLFSELTRWSRKYDSCCDILRLCLEALCSGDEDAIDELRTKSSAYDNDATLLTGFCLREIAERVISGNI